MIRCNRMRVRDGNLGMIKEEKLTLMKGLKSELKVDLGDFAFVDNGSNVWSLWKVTKDEGKKE